MSSFILLWNPDKWAWPKRDLAACVKITRRGTLVSDQWSMGSRRSGIEAGDRCYLLRSAVDRGLVASGHFVDDQIWEDEPWDGSDSQTAFYAYLDWDVVEPSHPVPVALLKSEVPGVSWDRLQGSGVKVPTGSELPLERLWRRWIGMS